MTWVWPFSLYQRIRRLEAENLALAKEARRWEGLARAAAVSQCAMTASYVAAAAAMAANMAFLRKVGCKDFSARDSQGYCRNCGYHFQEH